MSASNSSQAIRGRIGAYVMWSKTVDRAARTERARMAFVDRFYREAAEQHPEATPAQIADMAEAARKAHFTRLALKSHEARRAKKAAKGGAR